MESKEYADGFFSINKKSGFNPPEEPLDALPSEYGIMQDVLDHLPFWLDKETDEHGILGTEGRIVVEVHRIPNYLDLIKEIDQDDIKNRPLFAALFRGYAFLSSAYLLEPTYHEKLKTGKYGKARTLLPANLAQPFDYVAKILEVYPWMEYSYAYSLGNRKKKDVDGPLNWDNLGMCVKFSGGPDEEGFIMVHVDINARSGPLVDSIFNFQRALKEDDVDKKNQMMTDALRLNYITMKEINKRRVEMWKASDHTKYDDFRPFIMGIKGNDDIFGKGVVYEGVSDEPKQYRGQTGAQDNIIPTEDTFTGIINFYPENKLTEYLMDLREYRPRVFREFLADLKEASVDNLSIVLESGNKEAMVYFLGSIEEVYRFRHGHWQFVQKYIMANTTYAKATGGTPITTWIPNQIEATLNAMGTVLEGIGKTDGELSDEASEIYHKLKEDFLDKCKSLSNQVEELAKVHYDVELVFNLNEKFKEI